MVLFFDETHIRQILQAVDLVEVVGSYVALQPKGREMVGLCPFHEDGRPSLNVSPSKQIFKCFACGAGGDVISFVMRRERLSFPEAVRLLADRAGIVLPKRDSQNSDNTADRHDLEAVNRWAAKTFRRWFDDPEIGIRARDYVANRGITEDTARRFGLGWVPADWDRLAKAAAHDGIKAADLKRVGLVVERETGGYYDRFRERLIFPVIDALGRIIGFGGRTLGDDSAKYLNSPESELFDKGRSIYGIHAAKDAIVKARTAIVVEGYTDCLMAHQYGVKNVVATLGTALTSDHAKVLSRYADCIVLMFDSDEAGQKAANRAIEVFFEQRVEVKLVSLPQGNDPCDFLVANGKEAFETVVESAIGALDYKWQTLLSHLDSAETITGRKRVADEFLQFVAKAMIQNNIDQISQGFMVNHVAKLVGVDPAAVHRHLHNLKRNAANLNRNTSTTAGRSSYAGVTLGRHGNAQKEVLEVLLNRPELISIVRDTITGPEEFEDEIHQAIAKRLWNYAQQEGTTGQLSEILAGIESVQLSDIITDMAAHGADRGNYEETLAKALRDIKHQRVERDRKGVCELLGSVAEEYGEDAETATLLEYHAKWQPDQRRRPGG